MKVGARPEEIAILESQLAAEQARLERAKTEFQREEKLLKSGAGTQSDFDRAKALLEQTREAVNAANESLKRGKAGARKEDVDAQEAKILGLQASLKAARDALADTELRAPFAGKIARRYVENFQDVRAKQRIVSLQDVSRIEVVADVPEAVVAVITRAMVERFVVTFDFLPDRSFDAVYEEAETEADRRTQTYAVTLSMPAPGDVKILPGMSATVAAHLRADDDGAGDTRWLVPADAILADEAGRPTVWRVDRGDMTVRRVSVETAELMDDRIWVTGGVKAGDMIVTAGVRMLIEGQKVRNLESKTP